MAEYIDRLKIIERIKEKERHGLSFKASDLDGIPFYTDVQPVLHGEWVINWIKPYGSRCSCCGFAWYDHIDAVKLNPVLSKIETKYCPNCGARMDENDEVD